MDEEGELDHAAQNGEASDKLRYKLQRRGERALSPTQTTLLGTLATQTFRSKADAVQAAREWASRQPTPTPLRVAGNDHRSEVEKAHNILPPFRMGCALHGKACRFSLRFVHAHVYEDPLHYHWIVGHVVPEHSGESGAELTASEVLRAVTPRRRPGRDRVTVPAPAAAAAAAAVENAETATAGPSIVLHPSLREFPMSAVNVALSLMTVSADLRGLPSVRGGCDVNGAIARLHARHYQADLAGWTATDSSRLIRTVSEVLREEFRGATGTTLPVDDRVEFVRLLEKQRADGDLVRFQDLSPSGNFRWAAWVPARSVELVGAGFADVLVFDTTYQTNAYALPLVLVVGLTCTRQVYTVAAAVMTGETTEQYEEVLAWLAEALPSLQPESVIIDDSAAERAAIRRAWPTAAPVTCSWHVKTALIAALHRQVGEETARQQIGPRWDAVCRADTPVLLSAAWARFLDLFGLTPTDVPFDLASAEVPVSDAGPRSKLKQILREAATWQGMAVRTAFTAGMSASSIAEGEFARVKAELQQPGAHTRTLVALLTVLNTRLTTQDRHAGTTGATALRRGMRANSLVRTGGDGPGPFQGSYVQFDAWAKSVLWRPMHDQCARAQAQCHVYGAAEFDDGQSEELRVHVEAVLAEQQEKYASIEVSRDQAEVVVAAEAAALSGEASAPAAAATAPVVAEPEEDPRTELVAEVEVQAYMVTNRPYKADWSALCHQSELDPATTFMCETVAEERPVVRFVPRPRVVLLVAAKTHDGEVHYGVVCSCLGPTNGGLPCSHSMAVYSEVCKGGPSSGSGDGLLRPLWQNPTQIIQAMIYPRWYTHKDLRTLAARRSFAGGRTIAMDLLLRLLRQGGLVSEQTMWSVREVGAAGETGADAVLPAMAKALIDRDRTLDGPSGRPTLQGSSRAATYRRVSEYLKQQAGRLADVIHRGNTAAEDMLRAHMDSVVRSVAVYAETHPRARLPPETVRASELSASGRVVARKTITARGAAAKKRARKDERARVTSRVTHPQTEADGPRKRARANK